MSEANRLIKFLKRHNDIQNTDVMIKFIALKDDVELFKELKASVEDSLSRWINFALFNNSLKIYDYLINLYIDKIEKSYFNEWLWRNLLHSKYSDQALETKIQFFADFYHQKFKKCITIRVGSIIRDEIYSPRLVNLYHFSRRIQVDLQKDTTYYTHTDIISFIEKNEHSPDSVDFIFEIYSQFNSLILDYAISTQQTILLYKIYKVQPDLLKDFERSITTRLGTEIDENFYFDLLNVGFPIHKFSNIKYYGISRVESRLNKLYNLYRQLANQFPIDTIDIVSTFVEY